jgi:hypothetical protein
LIEKFKLEKEILAYSVLKIEAQCYFGKHFCNRALRRNFKKVYIYMKKVFLVLNALVLISLSVLSQNIENNKASTRDNPTKKYMRPSVTILFVNRGDERSKKMAEIVKKYPVPSKFNDHNVSISTIDVKPGANFQKQAENIISEKVSNQIVAKWFNRNDKGEFNMDIIGERGMYNASDADVMKAKSSQRKDALLKDAGENLLDRSYVLVYDVFNIKTLSEANSSSASLYEGYQCQFDCYVFRLDWTDSVAAVFYNDYWVDATMPNADKVKKFETAKFPVKYVTRTKNMFGNIESTQQKDHSKIFFGPVLSDDQLFAGLFDEVVNITNVSLAKENEDFKVKISVFSTSPLSAKIGLKEGLSLDKRFFVLEIEQDSKGNKIAKRKAVVRASTKITDNRQVASGKSQTSRFYQVAGGKIWEGMLMQENPDWGFGITLGGGKSNGEIGNGFHAMVEMSLSLWAGKVATLPVTGLKVYADFTPHSVDYDDGGTIKKFSFYDFAAGLSKDINFARAFVLVPFAGYGQARDMDTTLLGSYVQAGCRLGINIKYNLQIVGSVAINASGDPFDDNRLNLFKNKMVGTLTSVGLRYQF